MYTWMVCKAAFSRYIGVWLIGEGSGVLVGIHFCGYNQDGTVKGWDALSNVRPWKFETALTLGVCMLSNSAKRSRKSLKLSTSTPMIG